MVDVSILFSVSLDEASFAQDVTKLLFTRDDWPSVVSDLLRSISDKELIRLANLHPEPEDIQPRSICIAANSSATVVINWFDVAEYSRLASLKKQSAHRHHFDFGARILRGGYVQWLFINEGDLTIPKLRFGKQMKCAVGDGYYLPHSAFHHVFAPEPGTVTLMVRSPLRTPVERSRRIVNPPQLSEEKAMVLELLDRLPSLPAKRPSDCRVDDTR
ncbi:hypothetical protein GGI59_006236 [Rhizobium lentis]|uniref:Uncharacterized protein n=1 Tax=Rhizobium lentis TaxID=1138194 RepID=A0A7W8XKF3_9HYPH|nr:hypothetical protein [Rhizobium lentis]MBB5553965.1 hypothetical protein [Rhizobium lentis]MBB5564527.1 hypothetical protein [Rhizobium lentis]MBB5571043.1 hypothetical protein [Rhizobium lentis]